MPMRQIAVCVGCRRPCRGESGVQRDRRQSSSREELEPDIYSVESTGRQPVRARVQLHA